MSTIYYHDSRKVATIIMMIVNQLSRQWITIVLSPSPNTYTAASGVPDHGT